MMSAWHWQSNEPATGQSFGEGKASEGKNSVISQQIDKTIIDERG
jgi:hypothetical protein